MKTTILSLIPLAALLSACGGKPAANPSSTATPGPSAAQPGPALAAVLAVAPTGDAKSIHLARDTAKAGDDLVLSGQIMGTAEPFVAGRAAFILGDPLVLEPCTDGCDTPWDACCDSAEDKKRGTVLVQLVDAEGKVVAEPLEGRGGLAKLARLIVQGKVAPASSPTMLILNASAVKISE